MYYTFNLKELCTDIKSKPIWLRYVLIRKEVYIKYPNLSHYSNRVLTNRILDYIKDFLEFKFSDGTEYVMTEYIEKIEAIR